MEAQGMTRCPSCGHPNRPDRRFCAECGARLSLACAACGATNEAGEKFCGACGTALVARQADQAEARKVVTIVFADLVGSTALHERLDPESVRRVMDRYHGTVRVPVEAHGGTVVQLLGDGVLCAFGVPHVAEDDAMRAVRAAVAMQEAFREFARTEGAIVGTTGLRVAINTGEVVVSADHSDVVGDPVNVAARLQQEARDGDVLIGEATERVVRDRITLERFGTFALKGRAETVTAYRVVSLERPAGVAATPFVGREEELARLLAVYDTAVATPAARLGMIIEAVRRADETEDIGLQVAVRYGLFNAHFFAGQLREGLAVAEQGLGLARRDLDLGADRLGFSPSLGLSLWRGLALSLTGRPREGAAELDRVIERARTSQQLHPLWLSHALHVLRCEVTGEAAPALAHGRQAVDHAERTGNQLARIIAYVSLGLANVLNRAWHEAREVLEEALAIGRERRLHMWDGGGLAGMAAAHLGLGDRARALTLAEEAIGINRRLGSRFWEFSALRTRIRALRETQGVQATRQIEAALAEADAWLEMSGAKSYEPFLHVERAELTRLGGDEAARQRELRTAHRLFTEVGATARAEQVARELGV